MSETARRVVQNSGVRIGGFAIGAGLNLAIIVWIARYLGKEGFGKFALILAFMRTLELVADMGIRNILIRDIAVDKARCAERLGVARVVAWMLSIPLMGVVAVGAQFLNLGEEVRQSTYLAGIAIVFTFSGLGYSAVLRAFEEMGWDILGFVLHKVVFIGLIWAVTGGDLGLRGVFGAKLIADAGLFVYYWSFVRMRHGRPRLSLDLRKGWAVLKESFPLGLAELLRRCTWEVDKLILAGLSTPAAVGVFSAGYKCLEAMNPLMVNVTVPLFPVFARFARLSSAKLLRAYEQSLKCLYVMGIPTAVVLFVFSERIMVLLFGESYREAGVVLALLAPAALIAFPVATLGYVFTALGRQGSYTRCVAIALGTKIVVELLLVPGYSYMGAAVGTVVAEGVLFVAGVVMLQRIGELAAVGLAGRPLLAGLAMGLICWLAKDMTPMVALLGISGALAAYGGLVVGLGTFTAGERALLTDALRVRFGGVIR